MSPTISLYARFLGLFYMEVFGLKKIQQFYILKISSERIRENNYKLNLDYNQAVKNQEIISIADSQLVRSIHRLAESKYTQNYLNDLTNQKKSLSRKKNTSENRSKMSEIIGQITEILFIPQLISVSFSDKRHAFKMIDRHGFLLNGIRYVPFMASSGMIRRNTMLFMEESLESQIRKIFENGRDKTQKLVDVKYGVYYSLYSSSSLEVTFPRIAVVKDKVMKSNWTVDYTHFIEGDKIDPITSEENRELETNAFDGQGLVSPYMAKTWAMDLELDYTPSAFIVRGSFLKGLCVTFDFHEFARENNITTFMDIYGNSIAVEDIDVIISESQFKLWGAYSSTQDYIKNCEENELGWGITRVSPKFDKSFAFSSYQFIQSLKTEDVSALCQPTVDWLSSLNTSEDSILAYLFGELDYHDGWFDELSPLHRGLLLEQSISQDPYFLKEINNSISKKKKESCMGRLIFPANYQFMIGDPYAQCQHIFGVEGESLLENGECYSDYWNKKESDQIALVRSPIVHSSEVNVLKLKKNKETEKWYKHLYSGIVFPPYGISLDMAVLGGAD